MFTLTHDPRHHGAQYRRDIQGDLPWEGRRAVRRAQPEELRLTLPVAALPAPIPATRAPPDPPEAAPRPAGGGGLLALLRRRTSPAPA
ncbi:hypothetical protein [Wenxinia saemankumensis]|uniref:Uncharacterized protein n=1 Tax=Wenxinia saemankumensis TaxID=1447782 RepID=A0A1M6BVQ1_9RHOB|nr:hypothetical protein [Wenxinia saemankumensis]SHI52737.1 hypothetical protein SAMN05444417_0871 [Wenxinia saemankumensis]